MYRQAKPKKVNPRLPHPAMPQADWADCYQISVPTRGLIAMDAAREVLSYSPVWVRLLMAIRNVVVGPFGLKTAHPTADHIETIGLFPVLAKSDSQVVLGFDDRHLDFRVVIDVRDASEGTIVSATTLVKRKILFGKIYIAVITPFHNLIVSAMLANFGKVNSVNRPQLP